MLRTVHFNTSRFEKELDADPILATELADYLVRKGLPFRKAHAVVGSIVATCSERGISLSELPMRVYRRHSTLFANDIASLFHARSSVVRKRSEGSTSPGEVARALRTWERRLRMRNS
jgi:argininosuccinate lyase